MGQIKKLYQDSGNVETTVSTEENAVYPITASSAVYHTSAWGTLGTDAPVSDILSALNQGYLYVGLATPTTNPGTYNHKVFYIAGESGTYTYFGNIEVSGLTILKTSGSGWTADAVGISGGGGGGGTGTGYIGTTRVQNSSAAQALTGITNATLSGNLILGTTSKIYFGDPAASGTPYIEYNGTAQQFHFSKGLYSDYNVTAGGTGSGGGGGGGGKTTQVSGYGLQFHASDISPTISLLLAGDNWGTTIDAMFNEQYNNRGAVRLAAKPTTDSYQAASVVFNTTASLTTGLPSKYYAVQRTSDGFAFVYVPWTGLDMFDVNASTLADGQILVYNGTSGKWVNANNGGGGGGSSTLSGLSDTNISSLDDYQALYYYNGVWVNGIYELSWLSDVNVAGVSDGDVLTYSSSAHAWVADSPSGGVSSLDDLSDVSTTGASNGYVLTYSSGTWSPAAASGGVTITNLYTPPAGAIIHRLVTINGDDIIVPEANAVGPLWGVVSTSSQGFSGLKTFTDGLAVGSSSHTLTWDSQNSRFVFDGDLYVDGNIVAAGAVTAGA